MTIQELKDLVLQKIAGQGSQIDVGGALPPVLNGVLDMLAATQAITQVNVTVDEGTGTPSVEASVADGVLTLNFHNLKGEKGGQGNTGSSVDYPFELVNNLTTDDATKALSAAQGVVLDGKVSQLGQEVGDFSDYDETGYYPVDVTPRTGYYFYFSTLAEVESSAYEYVELAVQPGEKYKISGYNTNNNIPCAIARLSGTNTKLRAIAQSTATGYTDEEYTIPEGYDTLYINGRTASNPVSVKKWQESPGSARKAFDALSGRVDDADAEIDGIKNDIGDVSRLATMGYVPLQPTIVQDAYFYNPTSAPVEATGYSYTRIPCVPGDKFLVTGYSPNTNIALATAFKENVVAGKMVLVAGGGKLVDVEVTIPEGPYDELIVNGHTLQPIAVKKYISISNSVVDSILNEDEKVGDGDVDSITGERTETGTKTSGKYIKLDLAPVDSASYEYVTLPVNPGESYYIEGWNLSSNIPVAIYAKSGTSTSARAMSASSSQGMNGVVTVPDGYDTLYVNGNVAQGVPVIIRKQLAAGNLTEAALILNDIELGIREGLCPLYVKMTDLASVGDHNGTDIYIIKRFNETYDLFWKFQNKMDNPNKFFDFRSVGVVPRGQKRIQDFICISNRTDLIGSTSDYIMPICVGAVANKDGDFPDNTSFFTGGAHGYNNSGSSSVTATMREISRSILLDGIPVEDGDRVYGNVLQIDIVNNIQGCNTEKADGSGREIVRQHIRVVVDRENVLVDVSFTALEDVEVYALSGLGAYFSFGNVRFIGSTTKRGVYVAGQRAVTEDKHTNTIRQFGDTYYFDLTMDRTYGLAQDGGLAEYNAMGTIANKGYFNLIGNTPLSLEEGDMVSFRGSFAFGEIPAMS